MTNQWVKDPPELIALKKEMLSGLHPTLLKLIESDPDQLASLAAYCGIALDGYYTQESLTALCGILRDVLVNKREDPSKRDRGVDIILPIGFDKKLIH